MSDSWNNRYNAEKITAADVRPGDVIAGTGRSSRSFLSSYAFRTVEDVETLPTGEVRIHYRACTGQDFRRDFPEDQRFYRLPEMPERRPLPEEDPEEMPARKQEELKRSRETYAVLTTEAVLDKEPIKKARYFAAKYKEVNDQLEEERRNEESRKDRETLRLEAAGGTDTPEESKRWSWLAD